jgi:hypothetical protein
LNRKHPGSHARKSSTSTEAKLTRIVKSSSSTGKAKPETVYIPNKGSPKIIIGQEDSEKRNNKIKSSSKMSLWNTPDLSLGIENLMP